MTTTQPTDETQTVSHGLVKGRWINHWEPEDAGFWERVGRRVAWRNLSGGIVAIHTGWRL